MVVATGEHDRLISPARLRPRVRELLGVDIRILDRVGHLALREAPETVSELIAASPDIRREPV